MRFRNPWLVPFRFRPPVVTQLGTEEMHTDLYLAPPLGTGCNDFLKKFFDLIAENVASLILRNSSGG
jgi:hypothetical protein